ncbi:mechanosensitive ion channel [Marinicella sp. S1101]|uniref:mechanosensitive ion channel family protein n=1 Tax=Marinicella marina TaxID=2996016 RepID=UPI0022609DCE|nr:mechanosensitive ion channel domain-containing protein [Marinicella marina]MCX7553740.1 mechanosensitive ion channel [Marinicella marina]MDJ1140815.1 mechanosensitive ion channel [Marinicella marina]
MLALSIRNFILWGMLVVMPVAADDYNSPALKQQANEFLSQYESAEKSLKQLNGFESTSQELIKKLQRCENRAEEDISQLVEIRNIQELNASTDSGGGSEPSQIPADIASDEVDRQINQATKALISCRLKSSQITEIRVDIIEQRQQKWLAKLAEKQSVWSFLGKPVDLAGIKNGLQELLPLNLYFWIFALLGMVVYLFSFGHLITAFDPAKNPELTDIRIKPKVKTLLRIHAVPISVAVIGYLFLLQGGINLLILFTGLLLRDTLILLALRNQISVNEQPSLRRFVWLSTVLLGFVAIGVNGINIENSIEFNWLSEFAVVITPLMLLTGVLTALVNWHLYRLLAAARDRYFSLVLAGFALISVLAYVFSYANGAQYLLVITVGSMLVHWSWKSINWLRKILLTKKIQQLKSNDKFKDSNFVFPFWISLFVTLITGFIGLAFVGWLAGINEQVYKHFTFVFNEGFKIGSVQLVPKNILIGVIILTVLVMFLSGVKSGIQNRWFDKSRLRKSSREVFSMLVWYIGITIAVFIALTVAGFDISNLAIIAGALSVGIGFGLQNIVSNFVSGLILLFERPVTRGDWVEVGNTVGLIEKVKIRATRIRTFDNAEILVPNSELLSHHVTNWTLSNSVGRITLPVGVAYGSDVNQVLELLNQVAKNHDQVMQREPYLHKVLFREFGDSSLNFELRVMIKDIKKFLDVETELNFAIAQSFKEAGIQIPFPQRDLHIKDASVLKLNQVDEHREQTNDDKDSSEKNINQPSQSSTNQQNDSNDDKGEVEQMIEEDEKRKEQEKEQQKQKDQETED